MAKKKEASFEESLKELESLVESFQEGMPLEESLEKFEKSVELYKSCRKKLDSVGIKIKKLTDSLEEEDI